MVDTTHAFHRLKIEDGEEGVLAGYWYSVPHGPSTPWPKCNSGRRLTGED